MDLEELVLSGALFRNARSTSPVRSPSRSRSPSPDPLFPSNDDGSDSDISFEPSGSTTNPSHVPTQGDMGAGRTGVKGVIRDRNEAVNLERARRVQEIKETNRRMEKMALTARTFAEDEEERLAERAREEGWVERQKGKRHFEQTGRFGHLREVGEAGFVEAIEGEMSGTWIVLHIYDPSLSRCHDVDSVLARLARQYPQTKFLRARAVGAFGFSSSSASSRSTTLKSNSNLITISEKASYSDDEEDPYYYEEHEEQGETATDTDLQPTLLVYRAGQLVHNWIRVDWEAERWMKEKPNGPGYASSGIEALLRGHNIIEPVSNGNCGFSSDEDELALEFSHGDGGEDDDDELFDL